MRRVGIALTSMLAAATLFSAAGKLAGLDDVEELLGYVGVHGVLRDVLPFIPVPPPRGRRRVRDRRRLQSPRPHRSCDPDTHDGRGPGEGIRSGGSLA